MVFAKTVVTTKHVSPGNLQRIDGVWDCDTVTKGTIDLTSYVSEIYMCALALHTGTGLVAWGWNRTSASVSTVAKGQIAIHVATSNDEGQFWAIGPAA